MKNEKYNTIVALKEQVLECRYDNLYKCIILFSFFFCPRILASKKSERVWTCDKFRHMGVSRSRRQMPVKIQRIYLVIDWMLVEYAGEESYYRS
jgi:hypothetical protein